MGLFSHAGCVLNIAPLVAMWRYGKSFDKPHLIPL